MRGNAKVYDNRKLGRGQGLVLLRRKGTVNKH